MVEISFNLASKVGLGKTLDENQEISYRPIGTKGRGVEKMKFDLCERVGHTNENWSLVTSACYKLRPLLMCSFLLTTLMGFVSKWMGGPHKNGLLPSRQKISLQVLFLLDFSLSQGFQLKREYNCFFFLYRLYCL